MPRAPRRCRQPGCDELQPCPTHRRAPDTRPSRQERGYDATYDAYGRSAAYLSATHCETCGHVFKKDGPFRKTIGHRVDIRAGGSSAQGFFPQCRKDNYGWRRKAR